MRWEPLTHSNAVALLRAATENATLDLKAKYDTSSNRSAPFEIAKDVAAFANNLGGTIVVGVREGKGPDRGRVVAFEEMLTPSPGELVKEVDRAIRLFCLPVPVVNATEVNLGAEEAGQILGRGAVPATVLAINVPPMLNAPVGCLASAPACKRCGDEGHECSSDGKAIPNAYRFPMRVLEGTRFLRPDELAMIMNTNERRALLELSNLADQPKISVWFNSQSGFQRNIAMPCRIERIDTLLLVCVLHLVGSECRAEVPLRFVRATWQSSEGWNVAIDGSAFDGVGNDRWGFRPPGNAAMAGWLPSGKPVGG